MKKRVSITLDPETIKIINEILKKSAYKHRNRSHIIEQAVIRFAEKEKKN